MKYFNLRGVIRASILSLILVHLISCQVAPKPDNSTLTLGFAEAVFGLGIEPKAQHATVNRNKVIRWDVKTPVYLSMRGENIYSPLGQSIFKQVKSVYSLAGIELIDTPKRNSAVLSFEISEKKSLSVNNFITRCYASISKASNGVITLAKIVMTRSAVEDKDSRCIVHEAMHTLGFGGHPHRLYSVLSYTNSRQDNISPTDRQLIKLLYGEKIHPNMHMGDAITTLYSILSPRNQSSANRYTPQDISLEILESESPLTLNMPTLINSSKHITFKRNKYGSVVIGAQYGNLFSSGEYAYIEYHKLSHDRIFRNKRKLGGFVEQLEDVFGPITQRDEDWVKNNWSTMHYTIGDSEKYSCLYTIKYKNAGALDLGGHEVMSGYYCQSIKKPMAKSDAQAFLSNIRVSSINPLALRKASSGASQLPKIYPLRITGEWPTDNTSISAIGLIIDNEFSSEIQIRITDQVCDGIFSLRNKNNSGTWILKCTGGDQVKGTYKFSDTGDVEIFGTLNKTKKGIHWIGKRLQ